jgi:hypothetical protein
MNMSVEKGSESGLVRVMILGTALACGAMVASLQALRAGPGGFYFRVSWVSGVGFVCGTLAVLGLWKVMLGGVASPRQRLLRMAAKWVLLLSAVVAFLYPLRFVPKEKLPEVGMGLGLAVFVLSIVGWILWRIRRFLEEEETDDQ